MIPYTFHTKFIPHPTPNPNREAFGPPHRAAVDNDDTFSGYDAFSSFSPVDHTSAVALPEIFRFTDPDPSYSQSPFEPVHVVENGNGNGNHYGDDDGVFVSDRPMLPPPGEMEQEEGYASRSCAGLNLNIAGKQYLTVKNHVKHYSLCTLQAFDFKREAKWRRFCLHSVHRHRNFRFQDAANAINGTVITYGQTGAGKTYSMEGPGVLECDEQKKGLLPRVVQGLFDSLNLSDEDMTYSIKLSMVEIYMEKVRDLFDLSKDNMQIKESKSRGIFLPGVTEITVLDPAEALQNLYRGIANRAVGETQMNMASSRSHCVYIFTIQQKISRDKRMRSGKLTLVDLAGSEKVEKTGAEGRVLEEAKTINKSLSALGNVINSLTCGLQGKASHIPYRDSKLTRILQDALGGNGRTALLCCCSPSAFNASESLSTLRFGARAKHIKASPHVSSSEEKCDTGSSASPPGDESCARILNKLGERLNVEDVKLLEELFILEGIIFDPLSVEEESEIEDLTLQTISSLQEALEKLILAVDELKRENSILKAKVDAPTKSLFCKITEKSSIFQNMISGILTFRWLDQWSHFFPKTMTLTLHP